MSEIYVDTMTLVSSAFNKQVVCNGRVKAANKSDLRFSKDGITVRLNVKEGQHVGKGDVIASLDKEEARREIEKAEHELFRAKIDLDDRIIGLGYDPDADDIPKDLLQRAEVSSGYYSAKYQLESAKRAFADCDLKAPMPEESPILTRRRFRKATRCARL